MKPIPLGELLSNLSRFSWADWVYIAQGDVVDHRTDCIVLNPDFSDLGADDFTPIEAELRAMVEFLSIPDINAVLANLATWRADTSVEEKCKALKYYFERDAFIQSL